MSVNFVSLRMQNLKMGQLGAASAHNMRQVPVANADQNGYAERIFGDKEKNLEQILMAHLEHLGADFSKMGVKQNSDDRSKQTTVINEYVMSASPEYFRPDRPEAAGEYDQERLDEWLKIATAWAKREFGQHLLAIDLHCDEATPHLHICVAPLVEKTKNLRRTKAEIAEGTQRTTTVWSFNNLEINTRESMRERQTSAAEALKSLGLHRGVPSKIKHQTIKDFYRQHNIAIRELSKKSESKIDLSKLEIDEPPKPGILGFNTNAVSKWIREAYKKLTKTFPDALKKEIQRADKNEDKYLRALQAARHFNEKYSQQRDAVILASEQFNNDPVALAKYLREQHELIDQMKTESAGEYNNGLEAGKDAARQEAALTLNALKDGFAGSEKALLDHAADLRGQIVDLKNDVRRLNNDLSKSEDLRGQLVSIYGKKTTVEPHLTKGLG